MNNPHTPYHDIQRAAIENYGSAAEMIADGYALSGAGPWTMVDVKVDS